MRHSQAYYDRRSSRSSRQTTYHYPTISPLPHPPAAHVNSIARSPTSSRRTDSNRAQSSISSGESDSSAGTDYKHYIQNKQYQYSPQAEMGLMEENGVRQSPIGSHSGSGVRRSNHGRSEMVEANSTVFRYMQQEAVEEEQEDDHALWILVRYRRTP